MAFAIHIRVTRFGQSALSPHRIRLFADIEHVGIFLVGAALDEDMADALAVFGCHVYFFNHRAYQRSQCLGRCVLGVFLKG